MPNWTLTKFMLAESNSKLCWSKMLLLQLAFVVLVAVVVNAIAAIEDIRVHDKPINQNSFVKCVDHIPASSFKV